MLEVILAAGALVGVLSYFWSVLASCFVVFLFLYYYFYWPGIGHGVDPIMSVETGPKLPGQTRVRRAPGYEKKPLTEQPFPGVSTLYACFQNGLKLSKNEPCLGTRIKNADGSVSPFQWQTYAEVHERFLNLGSAFVNLGLGPRSRVGLYSKNCADWAIVSYACDAYSMESVAIYDTLGEEHRPFVVEQSEIQLMATTEDLLKNVFDLVPDCPKLKHVVLLQADSVPKQLAQKAKELGLTIASIKEMEDEGQQNRQEVVPPEADDLALIMYTSGTSARPKGVQITHRNIVATISGVLNTVPGCMGPEDAYLSYLPLAHILERAAEAAIVACGGRIGFYQGDIRQLTHDIQALKPTLFAGVPKVFQRVMNGVVTKVDAGGPVARAVFNLAFAMKRTALATGVPTPLLDRIVFSKMRDALGGRTRLMLSGGAPLAKKGHEFIRICFGCPVIQGYGLTETCGGTSCTNPNAYWPYDNVGGPLTCCEIKLVDAGNYSTSSNPPRGEICVSGPNVSIGYYKMPQKTAEDFSVDSDGKRWFHTGDVGQWSANGSLSIVGRTKDIFKLASGEYIAPEKLETIYANCKLVSNVFVYGESDKASLIAIVIPESVASLTWAKTNNVEVPDESSTKAPNTPASLCQNEQFIKAVHTALNAEAKNAHLNNFEQLAAIKLYPTFLTPDTGLVTSALKNKRPVLTEFFANDLRELYASLE